MDDLYPAGPVSVPATLTRPTKAYKNQAWLAVASLGLFVMLYFALVGWFGWTAWRLINTGMAGGDGSFGYVLVGGCAAFLCVFLLKALFFVNRGGAPDHVQVLAEDHPKLFAFLYQLADEAGAPRPHRVYLSARVNAAVFYDLSIFNLLFPSRKNLEIGLSLVNVLTLSELKAVLAHEFGHFAQRSMAIGSWVYIAQQIAAHVVAKRDALDKLLGLISRIDLRIAWIGWLLSLIVWSIRSLLDTVFRLVVLAQRALSRQMEFQADLVAVALTGSDELVHALHKLQSADEAWDRTLSFANGEYHQGRAVDDLFDVQTRIIERMAQILNDPAYGQVPADETVAPDQRRVFASSFAQPPQMWSTHPANADREENAKRTYLAAPHDARSAWLLFEDPSDVRQQLTRSLFSDAELQQVTQEQTQQALEARYAMLQYAAQYQGTYLGRALARHAAQPAELYRVDAAIADPASALAALYPASLAQDLSQWRTLEEEKALLEALRDKVYKASGSSIMFRGKALARADLARVVEQVGEEIESVRARIFAHDRQCRAVHLAVAANLGNGWSDYLIGLIDVLHYAEHSLADLRDAQGLLSNVTAVVTADGKVSARELKRLLKTANELHRVLGVIHGHKAELLLDAELAARLGVQSWAESVETFSLPLASNDNINDWMRVIDGWVNSLAGQLADLCSATLEQLLHTEAELARQLREQQAAPAAPTPSQIPLQYGVLLAGAERKRQNKLDWWDRFQIADGLFATFARLLVAGAIVGVVLGFGSLAGLETSVSVYNGLGTPVVAQIADRTVRLAAFSATQVDVELKDDSQVSARTASGELIETFAPSLSGVGLHYVYNVAGASPLVQWTAVYGNVAEERPNILGAPRWSSAHADLFFSEPPETIKSKSGGGKRRVLDGMGERAPEEVLAVATDPKEAGQIIRAHARWDDAGSPHHGDWQSLAQQLEAAE
nr:M48 family metallopeptidase [uncultured Pseudomonas sp.]